MMWGFFSSVNHFVTQQASSALATVRSTYNSFQAPNTFINSCHYVHEHYGFIAVGAVGFAGLAALLGSTAAAAKSALLATGCYWVLRISGAISVFSGIGYSYHYVHERYGFIAVGAVGFAGLAAILGSTTAATKNALLAAGCYWVVRIGGAISAISVIGYSARETERSAGNQVREKSSKREDELKRQIDEQSATILQKTAKIIQLSVTEAAREVVIAEKDVRINTLEQGTLLAQTHDPAAPQPNTTETEEPPVQLRRRQLGR